jgi:RNA polymerase sigma factor (sigma-70 family)
MSHHRPPIELEILEGRLCLDSGNSLVTEDSGTAPRGTTSSKSTTPASSWSCSSALGHEQDAQDTFQAAFLPLARQAAAGRHDRAVGSWLYRLAYRAATTARKPAARRHRRPGQPVSDPGEASLADPAWRELQAMLDEELIGLPTIYLTPFVVCFLEGKGKEEAANQLGWKERTVSSRLARALQLLQQRLGCRGVTLSALLCGRAIARPGASEVPPALAAATLRGCRLSSKPS